jgi:hypothetical protein
MKTKTRQLLKWCLFSAVALATAMATGCRQDESAPANAIRIKAGSTNKVTDALGNEWLPDQGFVGGQTYSVPDVEVTHTKVPELYTSERYSMTGFTRDLPNGKYRVKLMFAEVYSGITGPGARVFSFDVQGKEFNDFDIWKKAGGPNKAYVQSVDVEVTDGKLDITFTPQAENPKINAIEIVPR